MRSELAAVTLPVRSSGARAGHKGSMHLLSQIGLL